MDLLDVDCSSGIFGVFTLLKRFTWNLDNALISVS